MAEPRDDLLDRIDAWCDAYDTQHEYIGRGLLYETWRVVEDQTRRLAAAHAVIRRTAAWLDLLAGDIPWSDAEAAAIRAATADPTPPPETP